MPPNAILLKRAMTYLGLSGVALARMITACRDDGKTTAPETISRWLTGTNQVDPNIIGWMTELVRAKALENSGALIRWPGKGSITIAVANLKGGVGTTTVSHNLAFVVAETFRLDTMHIAAGIRGDTKAAQRALERLRIPAQVMTYEDAVAYRPARHQVVVVDIARDAVAEALGSKDDAFLRRFDADVILVPADFGSVFDVGSTKKFLGIDGLRSLVRLLHRPRLMEMNFAKIAGEAGLDVTSDLFCPVFIPQSIAHPPHIPVSRYGDWQAPDQEHYFVDLFVHLVGQVGGDVSLPGDTESEVRRMDLGGLLDFVTPDK